jgi:hypothetical protein
MISFILSVFVPSLWLGCSFWLIYLNSLLLFLFGGRYRLGIKRFFRDTSVW